MCLETTAWSTSPRSNVPELSASMLYGALGLRALPFVKEQVSWVVTWHDHFSFLPPAAANCLRLLAKKAIPSTRKCVRV